MKCQMNHVLQLDVALPSILERGFTIYFVTAQYIEKIISLLLDQFLHCHRFLCLEIISWRDRLSIKAIQFLQREGKISAGCTLMLDEMYLQKSSEYHGGSMIGQDDNGYFFNGISASMIVGLKKSIPWVIKAIFKTTISDKMVMKKISK